MTTLLVCVSGCQIDSSGRQTGADSGMRGILSERQGPVPEFVLEDNRGESFDFRAEVEGRAALLFFGYTNCPDVCPVHMAGIAQVLDDFPYELQQRVQVIFVTVDPDRDTPERLTEWLGRFDSGFVGLRGPIDRTNEIQESLGLARSVALPAPKDSIIAHSTPVIGFSTDGTRYLYPFGTRQADWRHDLPKLAGWNPQGS